MMQIIVEGYEAESALNELLTIPGIEGTIAPQDKHPKEGTLATIATVVGLTVGAIEIGERLHKWYRHEKEVRSQQTFEVLIETPTQNLLMEDATIEEIVAILKTLE
jgi:hypothetical protein